MMLDPQSPRLIFVTTPDADTTIINVQVEGQDVLRFAPTYRQLMQLNQQIVDALCRGGVR